MGIVVEARILSISREKQIFLSFVSRNLICILIFLWLTYPHCFVSKALVKLFCERLYLTVFCSLSFQVQRFFYIVRCIISTIDVYQRSFYHVSLFFLNLYSNGYIASQPQPYEFRGYTVWLCPLQSNFQSFWASCHWFWRNVKRWQPQLERSCEEIATHGIAENFSAERILVNDQWERKSLQASDWAASPGSQSIFKLPYLGDEWRLEWRAYFHITYKKNITVIFTQRYPKTAANIWQESGRIKDTV